MVPGEAAETDSELSVSSSEEEELYLVLSGPTRGRPTGLRVVGEAAETDSDSEPEPKAAPRDRSRGSNNIARKFSLSISWPCFNMCRLHSQGDNFLSAKMVMAGQGLLPKSSKLSHSLAFLQIVQAKASRSMPINFD